MNLEQFMCYDDTLPGSGRGADVVVRGLLRPHYSNSGRSPGNWTLSTPEATTSYLRFLDGSNDTQRAGSVDVSASRSATYAGRPGRCRQLPWGR